ncbi:MAG: carboxypeptidase-like regulatory domain-containing protein, partial [Acidobacteria bacterium]|nr:carboxypeptidase-like regulatory domain-containing protein [Acidobacteriota bacterium]
MQAGRFLRLVLPVALTIHAAFAQQYFGGLSGTITDGSGAVVPNATVTLTDLERGTALKATSNETGIYRAANLAPGAFRLEVEAPGFKKFSRAQVQVETSRVVTVDVRLELGASTESVTVSSAAPILDAESSATNSTVAGGLVDKIAVLGMGRFRSDTQYYLQQLPGSSTGSPTQERASSPVAVYGARSSQVGWDEDGMPNRSAASGANMHAHSVANEVVQDFRYTTVNATAESATPARISVITRGGTNQFHGSVYLNAHNSWFDANDHNAPANAKKPVVKHYYKGFSVEGPVFLPKLYDGRNRTFFIASVEKYSSPSNVTSYITVPTAAMRGGDFSDYRSASGALVILKDPLTGNPLTNNSIDKSRIYSGATNWLSKLYPAPTATTPTLNNNAFGAWLVQITDQTRYDFRADQSLTPRNMLFFRFNQVTYLS